VSGQLSLIGGSPQRRIREATRSPGPSPGAREVQTGPPWTREAAALTLEGWDHVVRGRRRIWCRNRGDPWSFWRSEESAYKEIEEGEGNNPIKAPPPADLTQISRPTYN